MKHKYKYFPPETRPPLLAIQHGGECCLMLKAVLGLEVGFEIHYHLAYVDTKTAVRRAEM